MGRTSYLHTISTLSQDVKLRNAMNGTIMVSVRRDAMNRVLVGTLDREPGRDESRPYDGDRIY